MMRAASTPYLGSQFDDFLFAPVGEEESGMVLSVVSALARLNLDPWQEAAKLTGLPVGTATQRLASLIAALPDAPPARLSPGATATRLIALLPRQTRFNLAPRETPTGAGAATNPRAAVAFAIVMALMLVTQSIILASRQPAAHADDAGAPASSSVVIQAPPPDPGR
jgi:hypothetical protein